MKAKTFAMSGQTDLHFPVDHCEFEVAPTPNAVLVNTYIGFRLHHT